MIATIPCKRPRVDVTAEAVASGPLAHRATCVVPGCSWGYGPGVKTDVEWQAIRHRREHRDAVPGLYVVRQGRGFVADCSCGGGKYFAGRGEAEEWAKHHLATDHGLVVCS